MAKYENKYGIKENAVTQKYHTSRRMFCIKEDKLYIAEANLPYSHAVWFEKEGWITPDNDSLMKTATRGYIEEAGNIRFYSGYDFRVTDNDFENLKSILPELITALNLRMDAQILGGAIKNKDGSFVPIKKFGVMSNFLD